MSDSSTTLLEQARNCLHLVQSEQLAEALVVLRSLSDALLVQPTAEAAPTAGPGASPEAIGTQQLADVLTQALLGATAQREDSRLKLQKLRNVEQVAAVYSASGLPQ